MPFKIIENQKVKITREKDYYVVQSLQNRSTPGILSIFSLKPDKKYLISVDVENKGDGQVGLWIGCINKRKCIYFGNFLTSDKRSKITKIFDSQKLNRILVGVLIRNPTLKSKFIIRNMVMGEIVVNNKPNNKQIDNEENLLDEIKNIVSKLQNNKQKNNSDKVQKIKYNKYTGENVLLKIEEI